MAAVTLADERLMRSVAAAAHPSLSLRDIDLRATWQTLAVARMCLRHGLYEPAAESVQLLARELPRQPPRLARFTLREIARLRCALAVAHALDVPALA